MHDLLNTPENPNARFQAIVSELSELQQTLEGANFDSLIEMIVSSPRLFLAGGGRSGLMCRAVGMRLVHIGLAVSIVGETTTPAIKNGDVLWVFSASGSGAGLATQVEGAKRIGANIALFTTRDSSLTSLADVVVRLPIGSDVKSEQHGGSLFEQASLILGDSIAAIVQQRLGISDSEMDARHFNLY